MSAGFGLQMSLPDSSYSSVKLLSAQDNGETSVAMSAKDTDNE